MSRKAGKRGAVIVVDDDAAIRRYLKIVLEQARFAVFTAEDGVASLSLLSRVKPVAILMDIEMPGWDGFQTCQTIRQTYPDLRCPIIFVTNRKTADDVRKAKSAGGDHFLIKPPKPEPIKVTYLTLDVKCQHVVPG